MFEGLIDHHGVLLRRDCIDAGIDDNAIRRLVKAGDITRIRQGAYAEADRWASAAPEEQHLILSAAVMRQYGDHVVRSHASACLEQGGPNWGLDLSTVHVTHLRGGGRRTAGVTHHEGTLRVGDVTRDDDGNWLTSPTRTVLDTASTHPLDVGVVVADNFLNRGLTSPEALRIAYQSMESWPFTLRLHRVLQLANGLSESVGETLSRRMFRTTGLPTPELQWKIYWPDGRLAGRCDFAWPDHRLLCEFDGKAKYLALRKPGETIEQAVLREKRREDQLRELTGWALIRLVWADLDRPRVTADRIRRAMHPVAA